MKNISAHLTALICCILTLCTIFTAPLSAENNAADATRALIDAIAAGKCDTFQEWLDGGLSDGAGVSSEWYVLALRQYDRALDFTAYADALEAYLEQNHTASAVSRQKYALILIGCGREKSAFVTSTLADSIGEQGIISWVYGLHLLNNGMASDKYGAEDIVAKLLELRLSDGGWALKGDKSDVDVTAMTVQALAPYCADNGDVTVAVSQALDLLGERQLDGGGFMSYGAENPESAAQVITALTAVGIDPLGDERFIKNGCTALDAMLKFQLADGSFRHREGGEANNMATAQAFYALVSLWRLQSGLGTLYVFDAAEELPIASDTASTEAESTTAAVTAITTDTHNISETTALPDSVREQESRYGYKLWVCLGAAAVMLAVGLILWLCKKRHIKNYLFVLIIGAAVMLIVIFTDFQTADSYYGADNSPAGDIIGSVTLTIRCDTIVGKTESEYIPSDGTVLPVTEFRIAEGESVFDVLVRAAKEYGIHMESEGSGTLTYISGINYLYEFDLGDLSGWIYRVNGISPSVGCGDYTLSDGDAIEWLYTLDLGDDVKQ